VTLEVVEPAVRKAPLGHEDLRVIPDQRRRRGVVRTLAFEVPVVLQLQRPLRVDRDGRARPERRLQVERLIPALRQIGIAVDAVVEDAREAVPIDRRPAPVDRDEVLDEIRRAAADVGGTRPTAGKLARQP
jgi:hypothetical protein